MNNCRVDFGKNFAILGFPTINDAYYSNIATNALNEILPDGSVVNIEPWYASESFSLYCKNYPSVFAHLGIKNSEYGSGAGHHNAYFDVDEGVLKIGLGDADIFLDTPIMQPVPASAYRR